MLDSEIRNALRHVLTGISIQVEGLEADRFMSVNMYSCRGEKARQTKQLKDYWY